MMTIKVAFIGAGYMAREHIKVFNALPCVEISGIYSRTKAKAAQLADEYNIAQVADTVDELYSQARPDLVVVAASIVPSRDILLECIRQGIPLLTEKPIALDLGQAIEIRDAARDASVPIWVGLNRRNYEATRMALAGLENHTEPRIIQVFDQQDREFARNAGHPFSVVDNWMYAASIHTIDYLLTFGRGAVVGVDIHHAYDPVNPTLVNATVHFDSGDIGIYTAIWDAPGPWACYVTTSKVRWELQPLESARWCNRGSRQWQNSEINDVDTKFKAGVYNQAQAVVSALRDGENSRAVDIDEALRTTRLIAELYGCPPL